MSVPVVFDNVTFFFNGTDGAAICRGLSFEFSPSAIVGIVGPSGVGKTTLLSLQAGLITPVEGTICIGGMDPIKARKKGLISYAPQRGALCTWVSALENVKLAMRLCGKSGMVEQEARDLLSAFGLEHDLHKYPQELSGGMQQRVILAMALGAGRPLVLLDEPFVALDTHTRGIIHNHLLKEWEKLSPRPSIIIVSHDIGEAVYLCDKVVVAKGKGFDRLEEVNIRLPRPRVPSMRFEAPFLETVKIIEEVLSHV
ncbi:MAG TPA: ATP-binding cassette domain-containing protein [Blastocatellia bacterium]|jgi:ABC-type nitrate/sulfonate/bicarbonate transport system ATPase subunit|nr:ATP-binding cassette domain-containing protein [Blastocatellia bacterium]